MVTYRYSSCPEPVVYIYYVSEMIDVWNTVSIFT